MLLDGVMYVAVNVGIGGAGLTFKLVVMKQPLGSCAVMTTCKGAGPGGMAYVAWVVVPFKVNGLGDQTKVEGTEADPDGVTVTIAVVLPQTAWVTLPSNKGAGVMVALITRSIGAQEPGGFMYKVY